MRFDTSMDGICNVARSESFADLNNPDMSLSRLMNTGNNLKLSFLRTYTDTFFLVQQTGTIRTRHSFGGKTENGDPLGGLPTKQFGIGMIQLITFIFYFPILISKTSHCQLCFLLLLGSIKLFFLFIIEFKIYSVSRLID